ncbi:MAG TPA: VTT domain-containing protein [Pyrinomonadaceae bacterium]|jgi:membrane protein YqaA with SNARE-associated domain
MTDFLARVAEFLLAYGPFGLLGIALLDSAFIPMAGGPDAVMIYLASQRPGWMIIYAAAATAGSVAGCVILYFISKRAGSAALSRFSESKQARVKGWIERYDVLSVLVASVLPPPFPFKLFVITAGVFRLSLLRFVLAVTGGRAFRYLLEGYLVVNYGEQAGALFKRYFPWIALGLVVLVVSVIVGRRLWRGKREVAEQGADAGD